VRVLVAIVFVLILALAGSFVFVWQLLDFAQAATAVAVGFVINASAALFAVLIGLSRLEQLLLRASNVGKFGPVADFWAVPSPTKPWFVVFGGRQSRQSSDPELRVSYSTVFAFSQISATIKQIYGPETTIVLKCIRDIDDWEPVASSNVVVLGGMISIPTIPEVFKLLPMRTRQEVSKGVRKIVIHDDYAPTSLTSKVENSLVVEDHALVTRTINAHNRSSLFTLSGGCGAGTGAAALAITSPAHFNATGFSKQTPFNEVVVSARNIVGGQIDRGEPIVDCRSWRHDNMDKTSLSAISRTLAGKMLQSKGEN
jgi:hypothetical protein